MGTVADATWGTVWPCISPYPLSPLLRRVFHPSPPPLCHPSQLLLKAAQRQPAARLPRHHHVHLSHLRDSRCPAQLHCHLQFSHRRLQQLAHTLAPLSGRLQQRKAHPNQRRSQGQHACHIQHAAHTSSGDHRQCRP